MGVYLLRRGCLVVSVDVVFSVATSLSNISDATVNSDPTYARTAEMTLEDDYGMIDGVINNGRRGEELEKAQEYAERATSEKPSIRERLADAKRECASISPRRARSPAVMCRGMTAYEPKQEMATGMDVLPGRERQAAI